MSSTPDQPEAKPGLPNHSAPDRTTQTGPSTTYRFDPIPIPTPESKSIPRVHKSGVESASIRPDQDGLTAEVGFNRVGVRTESGVQPIGDDVLVVQETELVGADGAATDMPWQEVLGPGQTPAYTTNHPRVISELTRLTYEGHMRSIRSRFLKRNPQVDEPSPVDLADFLISSFARYRPKTVLVYRSALLYCFRNLLTSDPEVEQAILMLTHGLPKAGYRGKVPDKPVTLYSSQSLHKRTFSRRMFERLLRHLGLKNNEPAEEMIDWLLSGLATGLRPAEWEYARWADTSRTHLRVKTLKRHLDKPTIKGLSEETLSQFPKVEYRLVPVHESARPTVDAHMRNVAQHMMTGASFKRMYATRRKYLSRSCEECFGENGPVITLYMMRGQFAANAKKIASAGDIADIMGCMPKRVTGNYGSKKGAHRTGDEFRSIHIHTERQSQPILPKPGGE